MHVEMDGQQLEAIVAYKFDKTIKRHIINVNKGEI